MAIYEVKKSKFISLIFNVRSKNEVKNIINNLKQEHKNARHICYAFSFYDEHQNLINGLSDDGEPKGTAGRPIYKILEFNKQVNKMIVVVRYFGGIKLGAGLLLRAYSKAASMALQ